MMNRNGGRSTRSHWYSAWRGGCSARVGAVCDRRLVLMPRALDAPSPQREVNAAARPCRGLRRLHVVLLPRLGAHRAASLCTPRQTASMQASRSGVAATANELPVALPRKPAGRTHSSNAARHR